MLTSERERLAEALAIERLHGDRARLWVAERLGSLLLAGDLAGVQRFEEIARRLEARAAKPGRTS